MKTYSYLARTQLGTLEKGEIAADSIEDARERLRKQHMFAEEIQQIDDAQHNVQFSPVLPWTNTDEEQTEEQRPVDSIPYVPLSDTLRLFAGWLLAWYAVVYLFGAYRTTGKLPVDVPFLQALFESPLVLRFACGTFLFLLMTSLHRALGRSVVSGIGLTIMGISMFVLFHLNA